MWVLYALISAVFAALVSILAKIGLKGLIRTWQQPSEPSWFFLWLGVLYF